VVGTGSEVLDKNFESSDSFSFEKDADDTTAKLVIQFLYTGSLEYSNESVLVPFMILANKLKVRNLGEFKVPPKVYLNGVIAYIEKDLNNRVSEFDQLAESVNFKKMEKYDLTKLYAKKKWLQKSSTFLNQIILKDMDDSDGSKSEDEEKEDEEEEEEDDEEGGGSTSSFDAKKSNTNLKFEKKNKICTTTTSSSWNANAICKKSNKYATKFGNNCGTVMIGFARLDVNVNQSNYTVNGWYYYTSCGSIYSQDGDSNRSYTSVDNNVGTTYGFKYDKKKGTITIYRNQKSLGVAVTVKDKKTANKGLLPNFNFYTQGTVVELIKFKGK